MSSISIITDAFIFISIIYGFKHLFLMAHTHTHAAHEHVMYVKVCHKIGFTGQFMMASLHHRVQKSRIYFCKSISVLVIRGTRRMNFMMILKSKDENTYQKELLNVRVKFFWLLFIYSHVCMYMQSKEATGRSIDFFLLVVLTYKCANIFIHDLVSFSFDILSGG